MLALEVDSLDVTPKHAPHPCVPTDSDTAFTNDVVVVGGTVSVRRAAD